MKFDPGPKDQWGLKKIMLQNKDVAFPVHFEKCEKRARTMKPIVTVIEGSNTEAASDKVVGAAWHLREGAARVANHISILRTGANNLEGNRRSCDACCCGKIRNDRHCDYHQPPDVGRECLPDFQKNSPLVPQSVTSWPANLRRNLAHS